MDGKVSRTASSQKIRDIHRNDTTKWNVFTCLDNVMVTWTHGGHSRAIWYIHVDCAC